MFRPSFLQVTDFLGAPAYFSTPARGSSAGMVVSIDQDLTLSRKAINHVKVPRAATSRA